MIISLFGDRTIKVTDGQAKHIDQLMDRRPKPEFIKLDGSRIKTSEITGIWSDEQWDTMQREKRGEWKCADGHWHQSNEKWCMIGSPTPKPDYHELREEPTAEAKTRRQKWVRLMQLNNKQLRESGKYGTLKTLEQLEHYEQTGEWPEFVKAERYKIQTMVVDENYRLEGSYATYLPDGELAPLPQTWFGRKRMYQGEASREVEDTKKPSG